MNWALVRDLQEALSLLIAQIANQHNLPFDLINQSLPGLTDKAILGMDPCVRQSDPDLFQRPLFATGVHLDGDAGACPKCCQEKFVWIWTSITATRLDWLVRLESVSFYRDILQVSGLS